MFKKEIVSHLNGEKKYYSIFFSYVQGLDRESTISFLMYLNYLFKIGIPKVPIPISNRNKVWIISTRHTFFSYNPWVQKIIRLSYMFFLVSIYIIFLTKRYNINVFNLSMKRKCSPKVRKNYKKNGVLAR